MLEMIILFFLIILNGMFVMAEIALVSARKAAWRTWPITVMKKPARP